GRPMRLGVLSTGRPPLSREGPRFDGAEAGPAEESAVALERLKRRRGHPLPELLTLPVAEPGEGDPVAEGDASARCQHAVTFVQYRRLVGNVQERLLAQARVEGAAGERERGRVAAHDRHAPGPHETVEAGPPPPPPPLEH